MFLSEIQIENFRIYGEGKNQFTLKLKPGLTALIGENDTGKTAVVDALRFALGTRDQEFHRVEESDFHQPLSGERTKEIRIRCKFENLTQQDKAAFAEHLTYEDKGKSKLAVLYINWKAAAAQRPGRQGYFVSAETKSGKSGDGPSFDLTAKFLLCSTYLRPLRDAERAMSAGRGSRLSQILQHTKDVKDFGKDYDPSSGTTELDKLSVLGIGDLADALLGKHAGVKTARESLNTNYLKNLSFKGDGLEGHISVSGARGDISARLRLMLEKLDLHLRDGANPQLPPNRGLGSNNILFMACELLLLGSENDGFPLLLIEEPEAHLHPQRQLRLMQFLQAKAKEQRQDGQNIQVIITTHSPNLASAIDLDNLVLLNGAKAFPLAFGQTELTKSDYGFLARFLDVTKANLFFARGVLIVEGDAENILVPTIARLIGKNLTDHGVSLVNVGGIGLRRYARIYQRKAPEEAGTIAIPIACLADFDVMPDCAPEIIGRTKSGEALPAKNARRWRTVSDFTPTELQERRKHIDAKASGQRVKTFISDAWTLEYDLAFAGLAKDVWIAGHLAGEDDNISEGKVTREAIAEASEKSFAELSAKGLDKSQIASHVYALFESGVSKAIAAQHLSALLEEHVQKKTLTQDTLRAVLPSYLVSAIDYVTPKSDVAAANESGSPSQKGELSAA
jgi:putative ATP-dependent endonuclease of the OLD family